MKTYRILLLDWISKGIEEVEQITGTVSDVKKRVKELQKGYCEDEKPTVSIRVFNKYIETVVGESDSDFSYISPIGTIRNK